MGNGWIAWYAGDYARDTADLSLLEDGAYRRLLDYYYSTGLPLPANAARLHRVCRAVAQDEKDAVAHVVSRYFVKDGDVYRNRRADIELAKRNAISEKRREAAVKSHHKTGDANASANAVHLHTQPQPQPQSQPEATTKKKEEAGSAAPKRSAKPADTAFLESLRPGCVADGIDLDEQMRKMERWLLGPKGKGRKLTRGFIINWLNKCDKTVNIKPTQTHRNISLQAQMDRLGKENP